MANQTRKYHLHYSGNIIEKTFPPHYRVVSPQKFLKNNAKTKFYASTSLKPDR
jgi:hypothetical protein